MSNKVNIGVPKRISTATTTLVKAGNGTLFSILVCLTAAGAITLYDGVDATGTVIGSLKASISEGHYRFDCGFQKGLCIVTAAASDITVIYE